ncbi:MAG: chemotaxis protein CheX [Phycisphaerae bacterium]|nr:chemotaxis protein CheX [Phycisphaerae bacterium]
MIQHACFADTLLDAAKEVFETMIFMDLQLCSEPGRRVDGEALMATITFSNSIEGCLAVCTDTTCAEAIAINMLGLEAGADLSVEEVSDAIGEVANMVMGSIKSRLTDTYEGIQVSIPSVVRGRELVNSLGEKSGRVSVQVNLEDAHLMEISLLYRESAK